MKKRSKTHYTATDLKTMSGLSYRQLNNWESKGVLLKDRKSTSEWRKFTPRDLFALMIAAEIRKQFNVPLDSIKWLGSFMLTERASHFNAAVELMASGLTVYILTDFKSTFIMDSDLVFSDAMQAGFFPGDDPAAFVFFKVNPIVNQILNARKEPLDLKTHGELYDRVHRAHDAFTVNSGDEPEVLRLVREENYSRLSVQLKDGRMIGGEADEEITQKLAYWENLGERAQHANYPWLRRQLLEWQRLESLSLADLTKEERSLHGEDLHHIHSGQYHCLLTEEHVTWIYSAMPKRHRRSREAVKVLNPIERPIFIPSTRRTVTRLVMEFDADHLDSETFRAPKSHLIPLLIDSSFPERSLIIEFKKRLQHHKASIGMSRAPKTSDAIPLSHLWEAIYWYRRLREARKDGKKLTLNTIGTKLKTFGSKGHSDDPNFFISRGNDAIELAETMIATARKHPEHWWLRFL